MTNRETVRLPNRQERFARALAVLIMGVGALLIGVAFIFRAPTQPDIQLPETAISQPPPPAVAGVATAPEPVVVTPPEPAKEPVAEPSVSPEPKPAEPEKAETETPVKAVIAEQKTETAPEPEPEEKKPAAPPQTLAQTEPPAQPEAKPAPEPTPEPKEEAKPVVEDVVTEPAPPESGSDGWIYAGQFVNGQWLEQGLVIGNELPANGQKYALNWGANIRATPPGKDTSLSKTIGYLPQGQQIQITEVKRSGNKGHVWLKIRH